MIKKIFFSNLLIVLFSFLTISCSKDDISSPTVTNLTTTGNLNSSSSSLEINGTVDANGGEKITAHGIVWGTSASPDITDNVIAETSTTFTTKVTGLEASTAYYFKIFATTNSKTYYSDEMIFSTTELNSPTFAIQSTEENTNSTFRSLDINGLVHANDGEEITTYGIVWGASANPDITNNVITETSPTISTTVTGLEASTTYYFKLFATTNSKTFYSEEVNFSTTELNEPKVANQTTEEDANPTFTTMDITGMVDINEGEEITAQGVVWGTSENPDISDNMVSETEPSFTSEITGLELNTSYYFRTFATTASGTFYSEQVNFSTLDFKDSKWDFTFLWNGEPRWNADVIFNADGTTIYDEPASPGTYYYEGTFVLDGTDLTYDMIGESSNDGYEMPGTISGKTMTGTYFSGNQTWTAVLIETED